MFSLTQNIRAEDPSWGQFVLSIGNGTNPVAFPHECCCKNVLELIDAVWQKDFSEGNCRGRAILTTTRADAGAKAAVQHFAIKTTAIWSFCFIWTTPHPVLAEQINTIILSMIPGVTDIALSFSQVSVVWQLGRSAVLQRQPSLSALSSDPCFTLLSLPLT
jgi:hypothetical protein